MSDAVHDANRKTTILGVSSINLLTPTLIAANPTTGALLIDGTSLYTGLDTRYLKLNTSNSPLTGGLTIQPATNTLTALVVNNNASGNVLTVDTINNKVIAPIIAGGVTVLGSSDVKQLIVKANATQTTNLQEWQNSSGTVLGNVSGAGNWGMGVGSTANSKLRVRYLQTAATTTDTNGMELICYAYTTGFINATLTGANFTATTDPDVVGNVTGLVGALSSVTHVSSATVTGATGVLASVSASGGPITTAKGLDAWVRKSGSGTITNAYGLYVRDVSTASTLNYAIYTNNGDLRFMSTPTTDKLGFWGATPVVRPTAYTQTYATASKTMPNATAADLATTATTQLTPYGFATQAQGDNIATQFNLLRADLDATKKVLNQVLDDLQILGLLS